jgi:hypothetical protein
VATKPPLKKKPARLALLPKPMLSLLLYQNPELANSLLKVAPIRELKSDKLEVN